MADTTTKTRGRSGSDEDVQLQVLGSGAPTLQEETRQSLIEQIGEEAYLADPERYWTAQQGPMPATGTAAALGPQKFLKEQLPDPNVAKLAGVPAQQIPDMLVLDVEANADAALNDPKGPEPGEIVRLIKNDAVNRRLIEHAEGSPEGRDVLTLTSSGMSEIRKAQEGDRAPVKADEHDGNGSD